MLQFTKNAKREGMMVTKNIWKGTGGSSPRVTGGKASLGHEPYDTGLEWVVIFFTVN